MSFWFSFIVDCFHKTTHEITTLFTDHHLDFRWPQNKLTWWSSPVIIDNTSCFNASCLTAYLHLALEQFQNRLSKQCKHTSNRSKHLFHAEWYYFQIGGSRAVNNHWTGLVSSPGHYQILSRSCEDKIWEWPEDEARTGLLEWTTGFYTKNHFYDL